MLSDGSGTATSTADIDSSMITLSHLFDIVDGSGGTTFSGTFDSTAWAEFTIGTGGGTLLFNSFTTPSTTSEYQISGPGTAIISPIIDDVLFLADPGTYTLFMRSSTVLSARTFGTSSLFSARLVKPVPEPASILLFTLGLLGVVAFTRKQ
jgi:hypothetical protein